MPAAKKAWGLSTYKVRESNPGHTHGKRICYHYTNFVFIILHVLMFSNDLLAYHMLDISAGH